MPIPLTIDTESRQRERVAIDVNFSGNRYQTENDCDIQEVENWYFRRYPRLARVIEERLIEKE